MKTKYRVDFRASVYSGVTVWADDVVEARDLAWDAEIPFDPTAEPLDWEIVNCTPEEPDEATVELVRKWCKNTVRMATTVDSEWIMDKITEDDCSDWLLMMYDTFVEMPEMVTAEDLWLAVREARGDDVNG